MTFSEELKPTQIFERSSKSIVLIVTFNDEGNPIAQGSGVVLSNNMVATNCHVVSKSSLIGVRQSERRKIARVAATYPESDLCLLTVDSPIGEPVRLSLGKPQAGEKIYTLGHPKGLDLSISEGLVSGFRRTPRGELIQFSAAISHGSSGGGLFNSSGDLVGITTSSLRESQNINFAIPVDFLANEINNIFYKSSATSVSNQAMNDSLRSTPSNSRLLPTLNDSNKTITSFQWIERQEKHLQRVKPDFQMQREFLLTVLQESLRAGIKPELVVSLIQTLSQYRKFHISLNDARGYMQIQTKWSRILGDGDEGKLFHMQTNLRYGCVLLRHQIDVMHGNVEEGLKRYLVEVSGVKSDDSSLDTLVQTVFFTKLILEK